MKELTVEEKIAEIKNTTSYQDVKNAWFPPYHEKEYYFISYSHKDYKLVYESLHRLQSGERRLDLWYDHNLAPGRDWEIEARRYIYDFNCKGVIFFISENAVLSQSIHKEIEFVKSSGKSYLSINLPCEKIAGHIGECLSAAKMLELLKQQGYMIENYEEKLAVLRKTFNDKITFLPLNEDIDSQITKILSLKREPLLEFKEDENNGISIIVSINNLYAEVVSEHDFKYLKDNAYVSAGGIGKCAFANCRWLKKIELTEDSIEIGLLGFHIGEFAFYNCQSLESITIPNGVTSIGDSAFWGCTSLESITIPNGVTSIDGGAFGGCTSLKGITIPISVTLIDNNVFFNCTSLKNITIPNSVISIGSGAFRNCTSLKNITIPNSVTSIGSGAFLNCGSLESITIPEGVTSISEGLFSGCGKLESITIPIGVTSIGDGAFSLCASLKSITIPSGVTIIGYAEFHSCTSLENITIPNSVTSIAPWAFLNCESLESITVPNGVTSLGTWAFSNCTGLKDIFFKGTKQQWESIKKDIRWDDGTPDYTVHCADGDLKKGEPID